MTDHAPLVCLAGAPFDSGNRGVEALGHSALAGLAARRPGTRVTVLDNGWGLRPGLGLVLAGVGSLSTERVGVRVSRRYHRPESWARIDVALRLRGVGSPAARRIRAAAAVWDVSGGDSFTDLYGPHRFRQVVAPKRAALRAGTPLVLLPQTYGPFRDPQTRQEARDVVRRADQCWARDEASMEVLLDLAGGEGSCHLGVDLAFGLPAVVPGAGLPEQVLAAVADDADPLVGVNVSGLLWFEAHARRHDLAIDYPTVMTDLVRAVADRGHRVLLVPHVTGTGEDDSAAVSALRTALTPAQRERTVVVPGGLTAGELKGLIARCAWFTGSRMHSTIAALSSGVPAAGLAYSDKTRGVFATCGQQEQVLDARTLPGDAAAVEGLLALLDGRDAARASLAEHLPRVRETASRQMDAIAAGVPTTRRAVSA